MSGKEISEQNKPTKSSDAIADSAGDVSERAPSLADATLDDMRKLNSIPTRTQPQETSNYRDSAADPFADMGMDRLYGMAPPETLDSPTRGDRQNVPSNVETEAPERRSLNEPSPAELELIEDMKEDIREHGITDIGPALTDLMSENRVVGLGESHYAGEAMMVNMPEYLKSLKEGGATHLAVEMGSSLQPMLDEFNRTGNLDVSKLPFLSQNEDYINMLKAARELGLEVVAVDSDYREPGDYANNYHRERHMADTIDGILNEPGQDPDKPNKVVFVVGARHLDDYTEFRALTPQSPGTATEQMRARGIPIATVSPEYSSSYDALGKVTGSLESPTMVSTTDATAIGNANHVFGFPNRTNADHLILFPEKKPNN